MNAHGLANAYAAHKSARTGAKIDMNDVYGTWVKISDEDVDKPGQREEVSFAKDGKYKVTIFSRDSIINSFEGTFELTVAANKINMTNESLTLKDMTVTKLSQIEMVAEVTEEDEGSVLLNYRKK